MLVPFEAKVTAEIINSGTFTNGSHTILSGQENNSAGFTLVGRRSQSSSTTCIANQLISWAYHLDITKYDTISFYARKNANHGVAHVKLVRNMTDDIAKNLAAIQIHYNDLPTTWKKYTLDVSDVTGEVYVLFIGGYIDSTGNTSSSTSYCDIRFLGVKAPVYQDGIVGNTNIIEGMVIPYGLKRPESTTLLMHFDGSINDKTGLNTPVMYGTDAYAEGKFKNAIKLNHSNCVKIPYSSNIVFGNSDFTVSGWFKMDAEVDYSQGVFNHAFYYGSDYVNTGIAIYCQRSSRCIAWKLGTTYSNASTATVTSQKYPIGEWFHIALVRNGTKVTLYYNGTAISTKTVSGSVYQPPSAYSFKIGGSSLETSASDDPDTRYLWNGCIDEVIIAKEAIWTANFEPPKIAWR